jgi:hypothetical protein
VFIAQKDCAEVKSVLFVSEEKISVQEIALLI